MQIDDRSLANAVRALAMDAVEAAKSGHPGMPLGMADVATVLFRDFLKFDAADPAWPDRDRFVLSAGHGSMLIYALLYLCGYERPTIDDIRAFRQLHSPCAGHPENFELPGIETTTGPLGQGLATAVGMAIAERHLNAVHGDALVDHRTYVIAGDGCLMEGINHEAVGLAGHLGLGRLIVLWDDNRITIDGSTSLSSSEDVAARHSAAGWHVEHCDGHDPADIRRAIAAAIADPRPSLVACRTIIGFGAPTKQGTSATHGSPLGATEVALAREALHWTSPPFVIPDAIRSAWAEIGKRGSDVRTAWASRVAGGQNTTIDFAAPAVSLSTNSAWQDYKVALAGEQPKLATRKASERALGVLTAELTTMVGGSADLTGSNNTRTAATTALSRDDYSGRYISYGIREFGMAAAMNGMALHGGIVPYGGTFLVFADYCRPAIRLSALQRQRVIYVMTHDSIGLGEDGPTHQPIEHLQSLRAMPNLLVFRPADALETAECWELALESASSPSVLALTRQDLPALRSDSAVNLSARGGYTLRSATLTRRVVLIATGSEVAIALEVAECLENAGIGADVVSMPCTQLFDAQSAEYRAATLGHDSLRVSIEAGTTFGWERYTGLDGLRFGIDSFGASAPIGALYDYFGLTAAKIVPQIMQNLV